MMDVAGSVAIGTLLVALVVLVSRRSAMATREFPPGSSIFGGRSERESEPCPPEVVSRIFSDEDREFVSGMQSEALTKFFSWERRAVALLWVRETTTGIKQIIRDHTALARRSHNLELRTELNIFLQYIHLRLICGLLFFLVVLAGPPSVRAMAMYADGLFQRFGQAQEDLKAAMQPRQLGRVDSL